MFYTSIFVCLILCQGNWGISIPSQGDIDGVQSRIIGGFETTIQAYPFTAAITVETSNSRHFCGGTLFEQQWIITAGQCVDGAVLFIVNLGSTFLEDEDVNRVTVATSTYYLHPDYSPETLENDIGLIKLRLPITFTNYIKTFGYVGIIKKGIELTTVGWGQISDSDPSLSNRLRVAYVGSITNEECKVIYGEQITENMVCIMGYYNQGTCHGDTGSPLIETTRSGLKGLVGIASFLSGYGCETSDPSGFTRAYPYIDWIKDVTGQEINGTALNYG